MALSTLTSWFSFTPRPLSSTPSTLPQTAVLQQPHTILIMMGRCTFTFKSGLICSCTSGSCTSTSGTNTTEEHCEDCGHLMSIHEDYGKRRQSEDAEMTNTESHPILDENTCPRTNTVKRLADILDEEWVVLVRGTPSTGKTTLAHLLRDYYKARGDPVVYIRGWKEDLDATSYLTSRCKRAGYPGIRIDFFLNVDVIFILDEAQDSYFDLDLWDFIKAKNDQRRGPKFCLFSSYGSPANGMVINKQRFTPPFLGPTKRVSIICSPIASSPDICLFYNEAEFEDVVRRYCMDPTTPLSLHKDAQKYLLSMTCGHPGAVASMLSYIFKIYGSAFKHGFIQQITEDDLIKALDDDATVFSHLLAFPVYRSFPTQTDLTPQAVDVLRYVLRYRTVPFNLKAEGMKLCFEMGWVHVEATHPDGSGQVCFVPSRLHWKYIESFLTTLDPKPFPLDKFPTLVELCKAALRRFSRKNLLQSSDERRPTIPRPRPPEAQYQDEFYRALTTLLGNGVGISSEWSCDDGGRIDFRITDPKWGVEILRDGDRLKEHCDRFLPKGKYYPWIQRGSISDWIILDCRCSRSKKYTPSEPKLWRAVFAPDYSSLCVLDGDNQEIMSEVVLVD